MAERLQRFHEKHGHSVVPRSDDAELYQWIQLMRAAYMPPETEMFSRSRSTRKRVLPPDKMEVLKQCHFPWTTTVRQQTFDAMVARLQAYRQQHGHALVKKQQDPELYTWAQSLRKNYAEPGLLSTTSKKKSLPQHKAKKLHNCGFVWDVKSAMWDLQFARLEEYIQQHGHCRVPQLHPTLGGWVARLHLQYRRLLQNKKSSSASLTPERLERLASINFVFLSKSRLENWEIHYQELVQFYRVHGHSNVPDNYSENYALGQWCMNQRTAYRRYQEGLPTGMTEERVDLLKDVSFSFDLQQDRWKEKLDRIQAYHHEHGHVLIPVSDEDNRDLRLWLSFQRYFYHRRRRLLKEQERLSLSSPSQNGGTSVCTVASPLTEERIRAMEQAIPNFPWKVRDSGGPSREDWADLFQAMRDKGIHPGTRAKQHWFDGEDRFSNTHFKDVWTEEDLLELWNQEDDDDNDALGGVESYD